MGCPLEKSLHNYGKIPCYQWLNPLYIAIFNSYVKLPMGYFMGKSGRHGDTM
jgi:hypothetical protein